MDKSHYQQNMATHCKTQNSDPMASNKPPALKIRNLQSDEDD
jgi:hypothetical protein